MNSSDFDKESFKSPQDLVFDASNIENNGFQKNLEAFEQDLENDKPESDQEFCEVQTKNDVQDLCESIPGLYRLLDLCKDDGSDGLVDKIIISQSDVKKLCNDMIPGSFKSISKINYEKLNSCQIHLIGIYGRNSLIAKLLLDKGMIDEKTYKLLLMPYGIESPDNISGIRPTTELRPGIYLLRLPSDEIDEKNKFMAIHWSEDGCYENKASSYCKKNMTNLHRYLTKITEHQICLMNDHDLEYIDWKCYEPKKSKDPKVIGIEFNVKKSEEQKENFEIFPGFENKFMAIHWSEDGCYENKASSYCKKNMTNLHRYLTKITEHQICLMNDHDLEYIDWKCYEPKKSKDPKVIGIEFNVKKSEEQKENFEIFPGFEVHFSKLISRSQHTNNRYENTPLHPLIVESVSNPTLLTRKIIPEKRFNQLVDNIYDKKSLHEYFQSMLKSQQYALKINRKLTIKNLKIIVEHGLVYSDFLDLFKKNEKGLTKIEKLADKLLHENYGRFETKYSEEKSNSITDPSFNPINLINYNRRFETKYSEEKSNSITDLNVEDISIKFTKIREKLQAIVNEIGYDDWKKSKERYIFAKNYVIDQNNKMNPLPLKMCNEKIEEIYFSQRSDLFFLVRDYTGKKDAEVEDLIKKIENEANNTSNKEFVQNIYSQKIFDVFLKKYKKWKKLIFPFKLVQILCEHIEELYPSGKLLRVNFIEEKMFNRFRMECKVEVHYPAKLSISLHEFQLDQSDMREIENDENFIPNPILRENRGSFEIILKTYDFKQIAQFNKKFLVFLWNKINNKLEIYFGDIQSISRALNTNSPLKKLNLELNEEHFMVTVNEPKGLIAIYDTVNGLNAYSFNQEQTTIHLQYANIRLQQWYNNNMPEIAHFFFIKNTDDICFVERNGQARIYNLDNAYFRPGKAHLPINTNHILCIPDGTCFIAFTKESLLNSIDSTDSTTDPATDLDTKSTPELAANLATPTDVTNKISVNIIKAHVYFCEKFTENAIKVIDMPFTDSSIDLFHFSLFDNRQIHLTTIDQQNGNFQSVLVKITHTRTKYRFERQHALKSVGQIKFEDAHPFLVFGENTKFTQYVQKGDILIIGNEKQVISEIKSDVKLKIDKPFENVEPEKFYDFKIKSRSLLNGLLDAYSMVFTKYAISSPIGKIDKPLTVYIALDLKNHKIEDHSEKFSEYFSKMWKKFKKETKKPLGHIKNFKSFVIPYQVLDNIDDLLSEYLLGEWLIDFFCLIPIQIAIAQDNKFIPLQDGLVFKIDQPTVDNDYGLIGSVSKAISFGWYEAIFNYYSNLELKVISSMGEQSCGKSYLLNHCLGTTFDGSAMRCTEGVWMSLVKTSEFIYIALDFEGLASIERTAQEETFLQLLNSVLSDLVLFKSQFAVTRDITSMFRRFQVGANYFGEDSDIFQATFCIVIKDVSVADKYDIVEEFHSKIKKIVEKEEENNFITKLFGNDLTIVPYPVFNGSDFYTDLDYFKERMDSKKSRYKNAGMFIEKIKVIMTKLQVCDWGSIQASLLTKRKLELKIFLKNAISFGFEQKDEDPFYESHNLDEDKFKKLTSRDDGLIIADDEILVSEIFDHVDSSVKLMPDTGLELLRDQKNFVQISLDIIKFFETNIYSRRSMLESEWVDHLKAFFKFIINRRISRVNEWFSKNISRFPKDHNEIVIINYALEREISNLNLFWNLCCIQCDKCNLKCLKSSRHSDNGDEGHSCLTDHHCHEPCHFKEEHVDEVLPECKNNANHEGKHRCSQKDHTCGAPCNYYGKKNCQGICTKEIGHEKTQNNEIHLCEATRHYCGEPCSLKTETQKGSYQCKNTCSILCEEKHELHECSNEVCPIECPLENCRQRCESSNHFHADEKDVNHFCGQEHQCQKDCEEEGICKIVTESTAVEAKYENAHDSFMFTKYSQTFQRLPCCIKIPPYKFEHDGKHVHEIKKPHLCDSNCPNDKGQHIKEEENKQNFHFCNVKCPNCSYYCTLPYCHDEKDNSKHSTTHGNMFLTSFTCEDDEFEFEGHRLNSGDGGDFVLCHKLCEGIGRHRHIDYCRDPEACKNIGKKEGSYEHINAKLEPKLLIEKDYVSHQKFWERTNFQDPYTKDDREEFMKCDHECPDGKHYKINENSDQKPVKSYCTQKIFHSSLDPNPDPPNKIGYISIDGHHFKCDPDPIIYFHIVFVIDRSGSMSGSDHKPEYDNIKLECLKSKHNNRLGAVYEAVYKFILKIRNSRNAKSGQIKFDAQTVSKNFMDTVSLVLFNSSTKVVYENEDLSNPDAFLEKMIQYKPTGSTSFSKGIKKASQIIDKYHNSFKTNVVVFLSDGLDETPKEDLKKICQKEKDRGSYLYLYTVMFANNQNEPSLQTMANIANEYLPKSSSNEDSLKCQYFHASDLNELTKNFYQVADCLESSRKNKPTLININTL
ncbi:hypothetical protein Glove_9g264 [Diversispora epigaea]|uniref:VWFA domain-containing protein n=1 Tax=Diversispora epigaea TaxID=1348612 RepID=A0A397JSH2_9GLOM|nr:hypothetical protein Glove_9g264 [Diversispora epigaea]